jgi:hypothetical protein
MPDREPNEPSEGPCSSGTTGPGSVSVPSPSEIWIGDGKPDLITSNWGENNVSFLKNIGPGPALLAGVGLDPNVINLKNHGPWITATIRIPGVGSASIDLSTLRLASSVPLVPGFAEVVDPHSSQGATLWVKFSRTELDPLLTLGVNVLEVTGSLVTGESFRGTDSVRVIAPPR